jgi:hypothetical protein
MKTMSRFARRWAFAAAAATLLAIPALGYAAETGKVRCEVTQAGKKQIKHVATAEACTQMGGKVFTSSTK